MSDKNNEFEGLEDNDREVVKSDSQGITGETENAEALEQNAETAAVTPEEGANTEGKRRRFVPWAIALTLIGIAALSALLLIWSKQNAEADVAANPDEHTEGRSKEVKLEPDVLKSANIEIEGVTSRPAVSLLTTTGTIELNPQQMQNVTPLISGRVEKMTANVGDYVGRGDLLAIISSPQIAQLHGKMHEAETRMGIAERNLVRVQKSENRVSVLQAKARLDEADATLRRVRRLIELEAGAGKDLIAAETNYKTAKAEYDFQRNISLNKEIQESKAEVETARVDLRHIRDEMKALGVELPRHDADNHSRDTSLVSIYAPAAGMVTERPVNPGSGIGVGTTLYILSNMSSVYAVASVPEAQMMLLRIGTVAEISSPSLSVGVITARVTYIDPNLNEDTRTGKVRLEVPNRDGKLRAGMFVNVGFQAGTNSAAGEDLVVNSEAVQRVGEKTVVFIPKDNEPGAFEVREIVTGLELEGYTRIRSGLQINEKVVTKGSFVLKTQLEKGAMGDDH